MHSCHECSNQLCCFPPKRMQPNPHGMNTTCLRASRAEPPVKGHLLLSTKQPLLCCATAGQIVPFSKPRFCPPRTPLEKPSAELANLA